MVIVVPFDGSELATTALLHAENASKLYADPVVAVTAIPRGNAGYARDREWIADGARFDMETIVAHLREHDLRVVDRADHEKYREAFVSPRSTGGVLFQLMEYEPGYCEVYGEPGVGHDLLTDHSYLDPAESR